MKIIFCDNTLWGLVNFRGEVIKYLKNKHIAIVMFGNDKPYAIYRCITFHTLYIKPDE